MPDTGLNDHQRSLCQLKFDQNLFVEVWLPEVLLDDADGDVIVRRNVEIADHWQGRPLVLDLGTLQSSACVFFNGKNVSGEKTAEPGALLRIEIPAELVRSGPASIAIRLWNSAGPGGFVNPAAARLSISLLDSAPVQPLYHPDYRADFKDGHEPYRYFRW